MRKGILKSIQYVVLLGIGILLLVFAFKGQDLSAIFEGLKTANYYWVFLSLIVMIIAHYARALRWNMLLKPINAHPPHLNTFASVMIAYLANLAFPRMGEVARCGALKKTDDVPITGSVGTVVAERIIDLLTMFLVMFMALLFAFDEISSLLMDKMITPLANSLAGKWPIYAAVFVVILSAVIIAYKVYRKNHEKFHANEFFSKIYIFLKGVKDGLVAVQHMERLWLFAIYSVIIWLGYFMSSYLCFFAIEATSNLGFAAGIYTLAVASIAMAAPVQGGIGTYHLFISQGLLLYGISENDGLIYATIVHSSQTVMVLIVGSLSVIWILLHSSKKIKVSELIKPGENELEQ